MSSTKKLMAIMPAAFLAAAVVNTGTTYAADLLMDPPVYEAPEIVTKASGGWYLRGDITYDFNEVVDPEYSNAWSGPLTFTTHETGEAFDIGAGVGYQINENFRVDLTGEYVFEADFSGTTGGACAGCSSVDDASFTAMKLLANAYVDLGNYSGFTPYVGAGIGGAYVSWSDLNSINTAPGPVVTNTTEAGVEAWRFAWALHAGASYDIAQNVKLDLGYTYSRIEAGEMFDSSATTGNRFTDDGIDSHVVRAGIRYMIW